jgi:hypothetical protein
VSNPRPRSIETRASAEFGRLTLAVHAALTGASGPSPAPAGLHL